MSSPALETPHASGSTDAARAGLWGQAGVATDRVKAQLGDLPPGFVVFHDLELPKPSRSVVDHLVVGPRNLWAVTTHLATEPVTFGSGRNEDTLWSGRAPLRAVLDAAAWDATAVGDLIGEEVEPVVCLLAPALPSPVFECRGIHICGPDMLDQVVATSTDDFVDVADVEVSIGRAFGLEPAERSAVPTLGVSVAGVNHAEPVVRRRRTLGARLHKVRSIRAVRLAALAAIFGAIVAFLPVLTGAWNSVASEGADRLTDVIEEVGSTADTADVSPSALPPSSVGFVLTCPTPGGGWLATWVWPGPLPDGVTGYSISTQAGNAAPVLHSVLPWSDPASPPQAMRLAQTGSTTVFTDYHGPDGDVVASTSATLTIPTETC